MPEKKIQKSPKRTPGQKIFSFGLSYVLVNVGVKLCSLITFPLLTRFLPVQEYGTLALINVTLFALLAVGKLGLPRAIVKFYPTFQNNLASLFSTVIVLAIVSVLLVESLFYLALSRVSLFHFITPGLFIFLSCLFFSRALFSFLIAFLRASEQIRFLNIFTFGMQAGSSLFGLLVLCLGIWLGCQAKLTLLLSGNCLWEGVLVCCILFLVLKEAEISSSYECNFSFVKSLLFFSFPLMITELANISLNFIDRYQILFYLDASAVGLYSVPYNLAMYIGRGFVIPLTQAIFPVYTRLYEEEGEEKTKQFLSMIFKYYIMLAVIIGAVAFFIGKDIIVLLASKKYQVTGFLFPWIVLGVLINGLVIFVSPGAYLYNKTRIVAWATGAGALFNFLSNAFFVPWLGTQGAAYSTILSYSLVVLIVTFFSFRYLRISLPVKPFVLCLLTVIFLFYLCKIFFHDKGIVWSFSGSLLMLISYTCLMLIDPQLRMMARPFFCKMFPCLNLNQR